MMDVRLEADQIYGRSQCFTCGQPFMRRGVHVVAYDGSTALGDLCEDCSNAEVDELNQRMVRRAEELRAAAAQLDRLRAGAIHLPARDDLQASRDGAHEAFSRELRLGRANARLDRDLDGSR
jgi:hypothetical protein